MPKHLFPGFRQTRTAATSNDTGDDDTESEDEGKASARAREDKSFDVGR